MKKIHATPLLVLLASMLFLSCSKNDDDNAAGQTRSQLILGTWGITGESYSPAYNWGGDGVKHTEVRSLYEPCEEDDSYSFLTGGIYQFNYGAMKCDPSQPASDVSVWELKNTDARLLLEGTEDFEILQLDKSTLKLKGSFDELGVTYTVVYTFKRK